jgi:class 3 adenylate cyclase
MAANKAKQAAGGRPTFADKLPLEGLACVLGVSQGQVESATTDLLTLGHLERFLILPADLVGPIQAYSGITASGLREIDVAQSNATPVIRAVLYADVVDSTMSNVERGNAEWAPRIDEVRRRQAAIAADHDARFTKDLGDGIMATFGSASAAMDAAVAVRDDAIEMDVLLKVGIHVGEVYEDPAGDPTGLAASIAQRIQSACEAGQVLTSATTASILDEAGVRFQFQSVGPYDLKGLTEPMHLYSLGAAAASGS